MGSLPKFDNTPETIQIAGYEFTVRPLTRGEAMELARMADDDAPVQEMEIVMLAACLDAKEAEVRDWYATAPTAVVGELTAELMRRNGVTSELGN